MPISELTSREAVERAVGEYDELGRDAFLERYGFGRARSYFLRIGERLYDSKAMVGRAYGYQFPERGPLTPADFSGGEATVERKLRELGFEVQRVDVTAIDTVRKEANRRERIWNDLLARGDHSRVEPQLLRDLRIYGGAQGVWVDAETTRSVLPGAAGIAVGLLHTGRHYPDAIDDEGVIYHYPQTGRPPARDASEVEAIRAAGTSDLPMFFIEHAPGGTRNVRRVWLASDDPEARAFYLTFARSDPESLDREVASEPDEFALDEQNPDARRGANVVQRRGQTRFRFAVFRRYGAACAVCGLRVDELLEAAHLKPRADGGSNDPQNGLPLCRNHHRAFDAGMFGIDPARIELSAHERGPTLRELGIRVETFSALRSNPHALALEWAWERVFKRAARA